MKLVLYNKHLVSTVDSDGLFSYRFVRSWNLLYRSQKWSDCHETISNIDWTHSLKCDHRFWPWSWLDLGFSRSNMEFAIPQPKMSDCHETKGKHIDWTQSLQFDLDLCPHTWPWPWIAVISEWEGRLTFNKGGGSRSFMTMTVTIWRHNSGVRICHIVAGVTSDVGVPSIHIVYTNDFNYEADDIYKSWYGIAYDKQTSLYLLTCSCNTCKKCP